MIQVEDLELIGSGGYKKVFQHPTDENKLIKVMRPERVGPDGGFKKHGRFKRNSMQGVYRQFRRELIQYLQLCKSDYAKKTYQFPIETPYELIATSVGLGLVVEKIISPSGKTQSLGYLTKNKLLETKHFDALKKFFQDCRDLHVVYGEVNADGIMYTEHRSGRPEFVLVDGIGERLAIPVRSWFKVNNDRYISKIEKKIYTQLEQKNGE